MATKPKTVGVSPATEGDPVFLRPEFLRTLERLRIATKKLSWSERRGEHSSPRKGFSLEFSDYRSYQPGDDLRYVDWNVYRRLGRLFLKLFVAEEEMNLYLLIDGSRSMAEGRPKKIQHAKSLAAALGYIGLRNLDRVGGGAFSTGLEQVLTLGRGRRQILSLFDFLRSFSCGGETDLASSVKAFLTLFRQPGLVVLLTDLFDPAGYRAGIDALRKRYEVLVLQVLDPEEILPGARGDLSLLDVESGREKGAFLHEGLVRRYAEELQRYLEEIESFCRSRGVDYLRTTTTASFEDFILLTLRKTMNLKS